jgi:hypothetical protein
LAPAVMLQAMGHVERHPRPVGTDAFC